MKWSILILFFIVSSLYAGELPIGKISSAPVIDGKEDAVWKNVPEYPLRGFHKPETLFETRLKLLYDDRNLYLFLHCTEPNLQEARQQQKYANHDAPVWDSDCIEMFFDFPGDREAYYQLIVDIHNGVADMLHNRKEYPEAIQWNGYWTHATGVYDLGWTLEVAIPWKTIAGDAPFREKLGLNISRVRNIAPNERTVLSRVMGKPLSSLENLVFFGPLKLERNEIRAELSAQEVFLGRNDFTVSIENLSDRKFQGTLELQARKSTGSEPVASEGLQLVLNGKEHLTKTLVFAINSAGEHSLDLYFRETGGKEQHLDSKVILLRQVMEINQARPMILTGERLTLFFSIFSASHGNKFEAEILDKNGQCILRSSREKPEGKFFSTFATEKLSAGKYTLQISLKNAGSICRQDIPLVVMPH
jgi:hypothetical protein